MPRQQLAWQLVPSYLLVCTVLLAGTAGVCAAIDGPLVLGLNLALLAVAGVAIHQITHRWCRTLVVLRHAAEQYAAGHLARRLPLPATEELGGLVEAMNQMAAQLDERLSALQQQRSELESVLASMGEGVLAVDSEDRVLHLNRALGAMLDLDPSGAEGRSLYEVVRQAELHQLIGLCQRGEGQQERDLVLRMQGKECHVQARATPLLETAGRQRGSLLVLEDVTRLRRLERVRQEFVGNVTHELRTPITAIQGFVETLQDGALDDPEAAQRFLGIIARHGERLEQIIEDLLLLANLEQSAEKQGFRTTSRDLVAVVEAARAAVEPKAQARGIRIDVVGEPLPAQVNERLLEAAVSNLLDNAVAYSEPGGRVEVRLAPTESGARIEVQDWGCGIDPEHHARLFERFYRVDRARSREQGGTGLGLAIVKHIAMAHGGTVAMQSALGEGSTFIIDLESR